MGYISQVTNLELKMGELKEPIPLDDWNKFQVNADFHYMQYFLPVVVEMDSQKLLGGESEFFVTEISLAEGDSGKAYGFEKHLPKYISLLNDLLSEPITGEFLLEGKANADVAKYVINGDGSVSVYRAELVFPETAKILK